MPISLPPSPMEMVVAPDFFASERRGGVSDHVIEDFAAHAVVVAVGGFTGAF